MAKDMMCFVCDSCLEEITVVMPEGEGGNCFLPEDVEKQTAEHFDDMNVVCGGCREQYKIATVVTRDLILVN
ncbi:MAG: hypothetical protein GY774_00355 [Planctomycetes bacterium]|nr:hypothetical protein [Planctomycetota bacterium]